MRPIYYPHLIKTGGTTTIGHVVQCLPDQVTDFDSGISARQDLRWKSGHDLAFNEQADANWLFTIREPASWYLSVYNHQMTRDGIDPPVPFEQWYEKRGYNSVNTVDSFDNQMVEWVRAKTLHCKPLSACFDMLDKCWAVLLTENLDIDLPILYDYMGVSVDYAHRRQAGAFDVSDNKVIKDCYKMTSEMRRKIYNDNPVDVAFYLHAMACYNTCDFAKLRANKYGGCYGIST